MLFKFILPIFLLSILAVSFSCDPIHKSSIQLLEKEPIDEVPSASGIEKIGNIYYLIGDNSPWLYQMSNSSTVLRKVLLTQQDELVDGVIPKSKKHDFEAMCALKWNDKTALFLFGSGSKWPSRNTGICVFTSENNGIKTYDLTDFYLQLMDEAKIDEEELNIEAAATLDDKIYLFNRGKNKLISFKVEDFIAHLEKKKEKLKIKSISVDLPEINGISAGFSGATTDENNKGLIFTCSVENTSDWVNDGEVLGSFIGYIDTDEMHHHVQPEAILITDKNEPLLVKVESVTIDSQNNQDYFLSLVTDSDGGISEWLKVRYSLVR
jgi:hypothetical protein